MTVESEPMSKSLGNFITIRDALSLYHPQVIRLFLLSRHYRSPVDFSKEAVSNIKSALVRAYRTLEKLDDILGPLDKDSMDISLEVTPQDSDFINRFTGVMDDDLNTAGAVGLIFEKIRELNKKIEEKKGDWKKELQKDRNELFLAGDVLGIFHEPPKVFFDQVSERELPVEISEIEQMIEERAEARKRKDWKRADAIRDRLKEMGVILEDTPEGTKWRLNV
ncbi:MAG: hypothetical protein DRG39_05450 [Deltaproteobacteria bacterium]|nr:MAG: hypothetical protein DRG39_05450 [Deltaproteobacteria bacterium]